MMIDHPRCILVQESSKFCFDGKVGKSDHGPAQSSQILLIALFKIRPIRWKGFSDGAFTNLTNCKTHCEVSNVRTNEERRVPCYSQLYHNVEIKLC